MADHWRTNFDWRAHQREINALPQFKTEIDGIDLHFMHVRSPHENALPLVPRGGHFAAMETPNLLVEDVRKFFRLVQK